MTNNSSNLQTWLPCPFCGSQAVERMWPNHRGCSDMTCGASMANLSIEQWNRRPTSAHETPADRAALCHGKAHTPITTCATCGYFIGSVADEMDRQGTQLEILQRANRFLSEQITSGHETPSVWRRLVDSAYTLKPEWIYTDQQPTIAPQNWEPLYAGVALKTSTDPSREELPPDFSENWRADGD